MTQTPFRASLILLATSLIWGTAFVAQKSAMSHIGPYWFVAVRYLIASLVMLPFMILPHYNRPSSLTDWGSGILFGFLLFCGSQLQQVALLYTSVANAGFITGLYVVLVPVFGIFFGIFPSTGVWIGAFFSMIGLYCLSVPDLSALSFASLNKGDLLILVSTIFWILHVSFLSGPLGKRLSVVRLAGCQFLVCTILGFIAAFFQESVSFMNIRQAFWPIFYVAVFASCIAYSFQIIGQRYVPAAPSAIILSLEAVFAAIIAWFVLGESLNARSITGCAFMLCGLLIAQLWPLFRRTDRILKVK